MARIPTLSKNSALAEVAHRYRQKAKQAAKRYPQSKPRTHAAIRIRELTDLFDHLWGRARIPEGDIGFIAARIMVHHIGRLRDGPRRISGWLEHCAGWMDLGDREKLINEVDECPLKWTADKIAWKFGVTDALRTELKLTTIGAIDVPKADRIKRRAEAKRLKRQADRRAAGATTRAQYLESVTQMAKPWKAAGVSRATWYRRRNSA